MIKSSSEVDALAHSEMSIMYIFHRHFCHQLSNPVSSESLAIQPNYCQLLEIYPWVDCNAWTVQLIQIIPSYNVE